MIKFEEALRWCLMAGALLSFTAACAGAAESLSGLEGRVTIGPTCPETEESAACEYAPFEATIIIRESGTEREIMTVQSGADGTFRVELPAGEYIVEPLSQSEFVPPYADAQTVTVQEGGFTNIEIVYDSGVR